MNRIDFYDAVEEMLPERLEEEYPGLELERKQVDKTSGSYEGVIFKDPDMCPKMQRWWR